MDKLGNELKHDKWWFCKFAYFTNNYNFACKHYDKNYDCLVLKLCEKCNKFIKKDDNESSFDHNNNYVF